MSIKFAMYIVISRLNWTDGKCFVNKQTNNKLCFFPQLVFTSNMGCFYITWDVSTLHGMFPHYMDTSAPPIFALELAEAIVHIQVK